MLLFSTSSLRLGVWWVIPGGLVCEIGRPYLHICPPKNFSLQLGRRAAAAWRLALAPPCRMQMQGAGRC
jgi:hypothetical protein